MDNFKDMLKDDRKDPIATAREKELKPSGRPRKENKATNRIAFYVDNEQLEQILQFHDLKGLGAGVIVKNIVLQYIKSKKSKGIEA